MEHQPHIMALRRGLERTIVGQAHLLDRLVIGLLTGGHILVEGLPGLAKTTAVKSLAGEVRASFQRIQFTPDLLPGDLTGTDIYDPQQGSFRFARGPIFHEIVLADEINRAPAKVQSALLEAMQERQVTVGGITHPLPPLFMVMATQNPLEQAGTYPLPEAQLDRFLLHVVLRYPTQEEEEEILSRDWARLRGEEETAADPGLDVSAVLAAREEVRRIHLHGDLSKYIVQIVHATRDPGKWLNGWDETIEVGASPRGSLALSHAAAAQAYLAGRDYVIPEDVQALAADCLRHRMILTLAARMEKRTPDVLIRELLEVIPVP